MTKRNRDAVQKEALDSDLQHENNIELFFKISPSPEPVVVAVSPPPPPVTAAVADDGRGGTTVGGASDGPATS